MGFIPEETTRQILDRCDIVDIISAYIPLKRLGRNYKALCPFHHEKTPSFIVSQDKQIYHCFGCGAGGNAVSFIMAQEHLEFPDAIRHLAQKVGFRIDPQKAENKKVTELRQQIYNVNQLCCQYYQQNLISDKRASVSAARSYLKNRGLNLESVKRFQIGFALESWDSLINFLRQKDVPLHVMQKAGLVIPHNKREGFYDRFRNRIIFPIFDTKSRCVAFGGRTMEKDNPAKYMNSPETIIYTKGQHLYGFNVAKEAILQADCVIVVEGYLDQITPSQEGVLNIVASLGTALTIEQIRLIRRYTSQVIMLFDSDMAGEKATLRSLDLLIEEGMQVKVAQLPEGYDPDLFVREYGVKEFKQKVAQAKPLFDFKMTILSQKCDKQTIEGRAQICAEILPTIAKWKNDIIRFEYIRKLARLLLISEEPLVLEMNKSIRSHNPDAEAEKDPLVINSGDVAGNISPAERNLLKLIMEEQEYVPLLRRDVFPNDFENTIVQKIIAKIYELVDQGEKITPSSLMNYFDDRKVVHIISGLIAAEDLLLGDRKKIYQDCTSRLKKNRIKTQRRHILQDMEQAQNLGNIQKVDELLRAYNQLIKG